MSTKLPEAEVNAAVEDALIEAACGLQSADDGSLHGLDFDTFARLVSAASSDDLNSLDDFDSRRDMDWIRSGSFEGLRPDGHLEPVPEA